MTKKFTEPHEVIFYECDVTGKMTLPMLLNIVIKTSESQSEALGIGSDYINSLGLGWVITQHEIEITRMPRNEEILAITTQATTYNKYFCYRDFWIHDSEGNECVCIHSTFVLMNLSTRKMTSVPEEAIAPYECEKIMKIKRGTKLEEMTIVEEREYRVRFSDIDGNKHVNNSRYLDWMVDCLPFEFLTKYQPTCVNIRFDKEVNYGNMVTSQWELEEASNNLVSKHRIISDGVICAEAAINWS